MQAVWSIAWLPLTAEGGLDRGEEILCVTDWSQTLAFYSRSGRQINSLTPLDHDPCTVKCFTRDKYLLVGGSDKRVTLWTTDGVRICVVHDGDAWVWCSSVRPKSSVSQNSHQIAVGDQNGRIAIYQLQSVTIHGLYQDRYVYRDNLTDLVVQDLIGNKSTRIQCGDYVKKIAVYQDRLAVQLSRSILIYQFTEEGKVSAGGGGSEQCRILKRITQQLDCSLLIVTVFHLVICYNNRLKLINHEGLTRA